MAAALEGAIVDLDGTVYRGDQLVPGADEGIAALRERGIAVRFLTNKAIQRRAHYRRTLEDLGVVVRSTEILTSGGMTAAYLARHHPTAPVLVIGEEPLREELRDRELVLTEDPGEAAVLLASMDRGFDYDRLTTALYALDDETSFIATNPDRTCPTATGEIPDCGAMVGAIEGATGRELERVIGKPAPTAVEAVTGSLGIDADRCLVVGDRLETDIRMGAEAGMTTVLVLSGVTDRDELERSAIAPDHVIDSLADVETVLPS